MAKKKKKKAKMSTHRQRQKTLPDSMMRLREHFMDAEGMTASIIGQGPLVSQVTDWVKSGYPALDRVISGGKGIPVGKGIELWGKFSAGKSALAEAIIPAWQAANGDVLHFDFELATKEEHITGYEGFDPRRYLHVAVESADEAFDKLKFEVFPDRRELISDDPTCKLLVIWDSVAGCMPKDEADKSASDQSYSPLARMLSRVQPWLPLRAKQANCTILFLNQYREKIGVMFGDKGSRPGGNALDHLVSVTLKMYKSKEKGPAKGSVSGYKVTIEAIKNRMAPPHQTCELILGFDKGFDPAASLFHFLKKEKIIKPAGGAYRTIPALSKERFLRKDFGDFYESYKDEIDALVSTTGDPIDDDDGEEE